tara:strand:+ start:5449 stop:6144 length:696 start_codon:yes stop_codon:yes gene_type:complete
MEKNWLIRTKEKEIIGPIERDQVVSFIVEKKLVDEDELCKGNSYWFFVKEKSLLKEFLDLDLIDEGDSEDKGTGEFVLESNSGEYKSLEDDKLEKVKKNEPSDRANSTTGEENSEKEKEREKYAENNEQEESLGDKFNLPESKKNNEVEEVKNKIHQKIETEIKREEVSSITKRNLIYPIVLLIILTGLLYLFYYVKFLGGKLPFISKADANTSDIVKEVKKKEIFTTVSH